MRATDAASVRQWTFPSITSVCTSKQPSTSKTTRPPANYARRLRVATSRICLLRSVSSYRAQSGATLKAKCRQGALQKYQGFSRYPQSMTAHTRKPRYMPARRARWTTKKGRWITPAPPRWITKRGAAKAQAALRLEIEKFLFLEEQKQL